MSGGCIQKQYKKRLTHRLRIIEGQIRGLGKAVENEEYCIDVLTQSSAIRESLKSFDALMLENHLNTHIVENVKKGKEEKSVKELIKIYKLNKK